LLFGVSSPIDPAIAIVRRLQEAYFGATLALRRKTLAETGGFEALKDCLADDYQLSEHARALGLATVLSPVMVATDVIEPTFATLWHREMRWPRTIRSVNAGGFASLFIIHYVHVAVADNRRLARTRSNSGDAAASARTPTAAAIPMFREDGIL
jgi:hypothetical protein